MLRRLFAYFVFNFKRGGFSTDLQHNLLELILFECQFWSSSSSTVRSNRRALPASSLLWNCMRIAFFLLLRNGMIKGHDGEKEVTEWNTTDQKEEALERTSHSFSMVLHFIIWSMHVFLLVFANRMKSTHTHVIPHSVRSFARSPVPADIGREKERERDHSNMEWCRRNRYTASGTVHHIYRNLNRLRKMVPYQTNGCVQTHPLLHSNDWLAGCLLYSQHSYVFALFLYLLAYLLKLKRPLCIPPHSHTSNEK